MDSPPTPPTPSSPPSYSSTPASYPQPPIHPSPTPPPPASETAQPPSFRHRKSSTIISISAPLPASTSVSPSPSLSPVKTFSTLPLEPPPSPHPQPIPAYLYGQPLERRSSNSSSLADAEEGEATPLLGNDHGEASRKWFQGPLFVAGVKLAILFVVFTGIVVGTFYFGMPKLEKEDRGALKLPRSFADLQALNTLFQKYKTRYPYRLLACGVVSYLFVQTFSLPGSMYISILFGAAYGMLNGLLLSCLCDSFGSLFCYTLSAILAPPLLSLPFYRARVETWRTKIMGDPSRGKQVTKDGIFAFLVVLRIAPFPPHWVANFVAPHLGIGVVLFWASCFIGIAPVSVIHVTIGSSLDTMTSAADFHLLSLRNILGLLAVVVAVLIPVGLKRIFRQDLGELGEAEEAIEGERTDTQDIHVPTVEGSRRYQAIDSGVVLAGPSAGDPNLDSQAGKIGKGKGRALEIIPDIKEDEEDAEDDEDPEHYRYQVYDPHGHVENVKVRPAPAGAYDGEKRRGMAPFRGYGAIEMPTDVAFERAEPAGILWPFSR